MRILGLKWRVALGTTGLTVVVLVLASAVQMVFIQRDFARVLSDQQSSLAATVAQDLDAKFATLTDLLVRSAQGFPLQLLESPAGTRDYFRARPGLLASFDGILIAAADGHMVADYPEVPGRVNGNAAQRPYFQRVLATRKPVISEPLLGRSSSEPAVLMAAPILAPDGQVAGVQIGIIRLYNNNFLGKLVDAKVGKTGYFVILTKGPQPRYVIFPLKQRILQERPPNGMASTTRALQGFEGTVEDTASDGLHALFSYKSLGSVDWLLAVVVPIDEAFQPIYQAKRRLWLICLVVSLLVVPLVWGLTWLALRPLTQLRDRMERLRAAESPLPAAPARKRNEISDLSDTFDALMAERAAAQARQQATEERLRTITDNLPALIGYVDADLRYRFINRAFTSWYGRPPEAILGHTLREVVGEQVWAVVGAAAQRALAGDTVVYQRPFDENNVAREVEVTFVPDRGPDHRVAGFYVLINDITALLRTKDQLRLLNAELEQRVDERTAALQASNRELETFAYSVAHDFRAPLRAMNGYSAMLSEAYAPLLDARGSDLLERIGSASTRLGRLIDDLLRLAQLNTQELKSEPVDLSRMAAQIVAGLRAGDPDRKVDVVIAAGLSAIGDPALLHMLLHQLLENAWKFTALRPDAAISVGIQANGDGSAYYVRDNGVGFDMAFAHKLFRPFARLHALAEFPGTGIGLALARRVVDRHGGRLWAEAAAGLGACFFFSLPGPAQQQAAAPP